MAKNKQKIFKVQCLGCGEILVSQHVHDYQRCSCANSTFVDGGAVYSRYGGMNMGKILLFNSDDSIYPADKQDVAGFLEFQTKNKIPKNKTQYTSEMLSRKTREER